MLKKSVLVVDEEPKRKSFWGAYYVKDRKGRELKLYLDSPKVSSDQKQAKEWGYNGIVLIKDKDVFKIVHFGNHLSDFREKRKNTKQNESFYRLVLSNSKMKKSLESRLSMYWVLVALYRFSPDRIKKSLEKKYGK